MSDLLRVQASIRAQWDQMINKGIMPLFELQTAEDEWLLVNIHLSEDNEGLIFSFDKEPLFDTSFSGEVVQVCYNYQLTIDECFDNLDGYLEQIHDEMIEGYLLPNNLYYCEG
jgi:hypothetical protein